QLFVACDDGVHGGIGHAPGGAGHALGQLGISDLAVGIDFHDAGEEQALNVGAGAADGGGGGERQRGGGAGGEVERGGARAGLLVDGGAVFHVVGHIGNVDLQLIVAVIEPADEHGIVEVAGGLAVNGDDGQVAEVAAPGGLLVRDDRVDFLGFLQHLHGKDVRDMVFADDHLHVNAEIVFIAEDLSHAAARALRG